MFIFDVFLLYLSGGFVCEAILSQPVISIQPAQAVGSSPEISITVTNAAQTTNVKISLGGTLFKTVFIRSSGVTAPDISTDYAARVSVTTQIVTANTEVRIITVFNKVQDVDNNLEILFEELNTESRTLVLNVQYCDKQNFTSIATASQLTTSCGFECEETFNCRTCNAYNFTSQCQATAEWGPTSATCPGTCAVLPQNMAFDDGAPNVGCGITRNVTCSGDSTRICGSTIGRCTTQDNMVTLDDATFTCSQECPVRDFTSVADLLPASSPNCVGFTEFQCFSDLVCERTNFSRQCGRNGIWADTTSPCYKFCANLLKDPEICIVVFSVFWLLYFAYKIFIRQWLIEGGKCSFCCCCAASMKAPQIKLVHAGWTSLTVSWKFKKPEPIKYCVTVKDKDKKIKEIVTSATCEYIAGLSCLTKYNVSVAPGSAVDDSISLSFSACTKCPIRFILLAVSLVLFVTSVVLLMASRTECCYGTDLMIGGIVLGIFSCVGVLLSIILDWIFFDFAKTEHSKKAKRPTPL